MKGRLHMFELKRLIQYVVLTIGLMIPTMGFSEVFVSPACSKELYESDDVHIVLVVLDNTRVDAVVSPKGAIPDINFPLNVDFIGDKDGHKPISISLVPYMKSPVQTFVCYWGMDGKYHCK